MTLLQSKKPAKIDRSHFDRQSGYHRFFRYKTYVFSMISRGKAAKPSADSKRFWGPYASCMGASAGHVVRHQSVFRASIINMDVLIASVFPPDIYALILEHADASTLLSLAQTCKFLSEWASDDQFWHPLFGCCIAAVPLRAKSWKARYRRVTFRSNF